MDCYKLNPSTEIKTHFKNKMSIEKIIEKASKRHAFYSVNIFIFINKINENFEKEFKKKNYINFQINFSIILNSKRMVGSIEKRYKDLSSSNAGK